VKCISVRYWEASSLLMLTVFLNVTELLFALSIDIFVQAFIVISLSLWKYLPEEVRV
jgi:Protein of unknown function (DUF3177)